MPTFGKRRSERVLLDVPLFIEGKAEGAQDFKRGDVYADSERAWGADCAGGESGAGPDGSAYEFEESGSARSYSGVFGATVRGTGDRGHSVQRAGAGILGYCFAACGLENGLTLVRDIGKIPRREIRRRGYLNL